MLLNVSAVTLKPNFCRAPSTETYCRLCLVFERNGDQEGCHRSYYRERVNVPGLDNLFAVGHALEILAHGFCLLSLELNGYLVTAAACAADFWWVAHEAATFADMLPGVAALHSTAAAQHALTVPQLYSRHLRAVL